MKHGATRNIDMVGMGLFTLDVDSANPFAGAVQIDWSFLQRMKRDRTCRQHPEVLKEVQRRTLVPQ